MHIPHIYKNQNISAVKSFLEENSFGILLNLTDNRITGTHIPIELDVNEQGQDVLVGHISKANPQWKTFEDGEEVLAIFPGPHSYISSSWYEKENVPTWNYVAVHIYGTIKIIKGEALLTSLKKLVNKYEKHMENPVTVEGMSNKTLKQINGIIGFSIKITDIQAAEKLSQNRNDKDHHNIISELEGNEDTQSKKIAEEMKKHRE